MKKSKRRVRIPKDTGKDAPLNTRVDLRKKAALQAWCRSNYRTPSSMVQQWLDEFLEKEGLELPDPDEALAILKGGSSQ